eukprot:EG_transcript_6839
MACVPRGLPAQDDTTTMLLLAAGPRPANGSGLPRLALPLCAVLALFALALALPAGTLFSALYAPSPTTPSLAVPLRGMTPMPGAGRSSARPAPRSEGVPHRRPSGPARDALAYGASGLLREQPEGRRPLTLTSASLSQGSEGRVVRAAWAVFVPALVAATVGKVGGFVLTVYRGGRSFLHAGHAPCPSAEEERRRNLRACQRVAVLGIVANLFLFVMQAVTGFAGNSAGLIAKAVDSFGDLMADAVSYLSIKQAHRPADKYHQFGHGKYESLGALSIAALLVFAAYEAATESFEALENAYLNSVLEGPTMFALWGAVASVVIKEALYRVMMSVGKATNSDSTMANAKHHRMDGFASGIVFVGIIGGRLGCKYADPVAGIFVALFILKAAFNIAQEAFNDLTDGIPNLEDVDLDRMLTDAVAGSPAVTGYANLRSRKMGPFIALQFDMFVQPDLTVEQVALVEDQVKQHVLTRNEAITEIGIRVLPAAPVPALMPAFAA